MRLYPSDPAFLAINEQQFRYCRFVNRHMHPQDGAGELPEPEAEVMRREILEDLRVLLED